MKPRYVVSSVTGWAITPTGATTGPTPQTIWTVLDSAFCYRPVTKIRRGGGGSFRARTSFGDKGERQMRELADRLNAEDEQ